MTRLSDLRHFRPLRAGDGRLFAAERAGMSLASSLALPITSRLWARS